MAYVEKNCVVRFGEAFGVLRGETSGESGFPP